MSDKDQLKQKEENTKSSADVPNEEFWKTMVERLSRESSSDVNNETNELQQKVANQKGEDTKSFTDLAEEDFWQVIAKDLSTEISSETNDDTEQALPETNDDLKELLLEANGDLKESLPEVNDEIEEPLPEVSNRLNELRQRLKLILLARLPEKKAIEFIEQLYACSSEEELKVEAKIMAKKITLIINVSVGKEILAALYY